ncbi:uncharacterized protein LOC135939156 isoform X2 [Cloeon dipterum]|uniref:uncharacterized protein LOC135939156 isoform X2 n=1 Tax=Cloeon dipterum TaxID=197152 RepID=UPI00321FF1EE
MYCGFVLLLSAWAIVVGAWPAEQTSGSSCWIDKGKQCGGHGKCDDQVCACDPCWQGRACDTYVDVHQPRFLVNNFYIIVNKSFAGSVFRAEATDDDLGMTCPLHGPGEGTTCPCATTRFKMLHGADSTLFNVDNETGDVFLAEGATLQAGRQYHFTLQAQGLKVSGLDNKVGRDLMRAIVYVRPEASKQRLALDPLSQPLILRKKREVKSKSEISMEFIRLSPEDEKLQIGSSIAYKAVVHLPAERSWSRPLGVEISTDQSEATLALCQARVSGVKGALVSSLGPINTLEPQLFTHKTLSTMYVQAVFDFGVISLLEHNANDSRPSVEMIFEAIVVRASAKEAPLQYIRGTLFTDEAAASTALDLSDVPAKTASSDQRSTLQTMHADADVAPDRPADLHWRFQPAAASGDLTLAIRQLPGEQVSVRVGGLSVSSDDDAFHCLAPPRAELASQACLLIDDSNNGSLLANLHLPVYIHRRTGSALTIKAWLLPLRSRPFAVVEALFSTSQGAAWRSLHNVSVAPASLHPAAPSTPKLVVKAASASEVPAGIPVVYHAKLQLPRGLFNLTAALRTLTKGAAVTDIGLLSVGPDVDQDLLKQYQIVRKSDGELVFQVSDPVLVRQDAKDAVVLKMCVVGNAKGVAKFGLRLLAYPQVEQLVFQAVVTPYQAPFVTPEVSITPYEDQTLFEQQGALEFRLEMKVPEGTCIKPVKLELGSSFKGSGEVTTDLCRVTFAEHSGITPKKLVPNHVLDLGSLCAPRMSRTRSSARNHHSFTLQASFRASTLREQDVEGIIRIDARMQMGGVSFWSGGVSTHLVDRLSVLKGCEISSATANACEL